MDGNLPKVSPQEKFPQGLHNLIASREWSDLGPSLLLTMEMINDFARLSGDRNPIHIDEEAAKRRGHRTVVAHGMLLAILLPRLDPLNKPLVEESGLDIMDRNPSPNFCAFVSAGTLLRLRNRVLDYKEKFGKGFLRLEYRLYGDNLDIDKPVMEFSRTLVCSIPSG